MPSNEPKDRWLQVEVALIRAFIVLDLALRLYGIVHGQMVAEKLIG